MRAPGPSKIMGSHRVAVHPHRRRLEEEAVASAQIRVLEKRERRKEDGNKRQSEKPLEAFSYFDADLRGEKSIRPYCLQVSA